MKHLIAIILCGVSLCAQENAMKANCYSDLQSNGTGWLSFGPGVINSAVGARCSVMVGDEVMEIKVDSENGMVALRQFLTDVFRERLNLAPKSPRSDSVEYANAVVLFGSLEFREDSLLAYIPLTSITTGRNADELTELLGRYRSILNVE